MCIIKYSENGYNILKSYKKKGPIVSVTSLQRIISAYIGGSKHGILSIKKAKRWGDKTDKKKVTISQKKVFFMWSNGVVKK